MAEPIDHKRRKGGPYAERPPPNDETRHKISETLKEHNRKTGLGTIMGNRLAKIKRAKPKP